MIMMGFGGMMLFGIAVLFAVVLLVNDISQPIGQPERVQPVSARQILDRQYAKGEITQEQYYSMINDIK